MLVAVVAFLGRDFSRISPVPADVAVDRAAKWNDSGSDARVVENGSDEDANTDSDVDEAPESAADGSLQDRDSSQTQASSSAVLFDSKTVEVCMKSLDMICDLCSCAFLRWVSLPPGAGALRCSLRCGD